MMDATHSAGREVAAIEWVRLRVTDDERRVRNALNITEPRGDAFAFGGGEEPCRACLLGWTWTANVRFGLTESDITNYMTGGIIPAVRAATQTVLDWDPDADHEVGDPETAATARGPEVLNEILDLALESVLDRVAAR